MHASSNDSPRCPVCDGETAEYCRKRAFDQEWIIARCRSCGHGFVVNRPSLETLAEVYAGVDHHPMDPISADLLEDKPICRQVANDVRELTDARGRVLDIGCGDGGFAYHLAKLGFGPFLLIDIDDRSERSAEVVPNSEFRRVPFEDIEDEQFSLIVMSQVLEHAHDPMGWLHRARRLLDDDGMLVVALPNFGGVYRLIGSRDPMIIPPMHLSYFTARSLRLALEQAGFEIVRQQSDSQVLIRADGMSLPRRAAGRVWNTASRMLNPTMRGIFLQYYARPVAPRDA
ncbi:MAG: methyltransferase domain-containing protein [Planctomycetota bacterium]